MKHPILFTATAVLSLAAAAWSNERESIAALEAAGAFVQRDESQPDKPVVQVTYNLRQVTDAGNNALKEIEDLPSIEFLGAGDTEISADTLRALQGKKSLRRFSIAYAKISDESATILATLRSLEALDLRVQIEISPLGMDEILRMTNLRELMLSDRLVNDDILEALSRFSNLRTLTVRSIFVSDEGLRSLRRLKHLQTLRMFLSTEVTGQGLRYLAELRLKDVEITYFNVTDSDLKELRKLHGLKTLRLMNAIKITDAAVPFLSEMTELTELEIVGVKLSNEAIEKLNRALPKCKIRQGTL
jgi:hypothetical protein